MVHFMIITQILLRLHVNDNNGYVYLNFFKKKKNQAFRNWWQSTVL